MSTPQTEARKQLFIKLSNFIPDEEMSWVSKALYELEILQLYETQLKLLDDVRKIWHNTDDNGFAEAMNEIGKGIADNYKSLQATLKNKEEI